MFLFRITLMFLFLASLTLTGTAQSDRPPKPLDPLNIPKYVTALVIPPVMPAVSDGYYEIAARQFEQQILPEGMPQTTVFGYGRAGDPLPGEGEDTTFNFPAFTMEAQSGVPVRVKWINQLVDDPNSENPQFLSHLLPVDPTVHWANPGGGEEMKDMRSHEPDLYTGPVPIITHVHGAHVLPTSDGYPESWYLPAAANIPDEYAAKGSNYGSVEPVETGAALFEYANDQPAGILWYHDHTLGMTRLNVYAGMAGFWFVRDEVEANLNLPGPAPKFGDMPDTKYYEIPLAIQDRSFFEDGSLFYPESREFFDEYEGPYFPDTAVPPAWNPEVFGNTMVVNGKTWPYFEVEPRLYRFRMLNGTNGRFLVLKFDHELSFNVIGTEGGFLPGSPLVLDELLMAPAERFDVIVDFSKFEPGDEILLQNFGPDSPFGGFPIEAEDMANPETTGQVMQFRVVELTDNGSPGEIPTELPTIERLETTLPERHLTLNEEMMLPEDIPVAAILGTNADGPMGWMEDITERPQVNTVEIWTITNLTADAHPIHLHQVMFQVIDRTPLDGDTFHEAQEAFIMGRQAADAPNPFDFVTGDTLISEAWEMGWKDTVISYPGQITRIIAHFDIPGLYVWHCHIVEHEDNEMMRPFEVIEP